MKTLIVCIVSFVLIDKLHAQSGFYKDSSLFSLRGNQHRLHDFNFSEYKNYNLIVPGANLNNNLKLPDASVLKLPKPVLTYVGKGNHLEIYKSAPDNMYVAMPDSTFFSPMPVADAR